MTRAPCAPPAAHELNPLGGRLRCRWLGSRSGVAMTHVHFYGRTRCIGISSWSRKWGWRSAAVSFLGPCVCSTLWFLLLVLCLFYFLRLLKWSIYCRLSFLCRLCAVLDSLCVFCPFLLIFHAGSSVTFLFSSYFDWFFAFFCGTRFHRHMFPFLCIQSPCSRFCLLCVRSFREFV